MTTHDRILGRRRRTRVALLAVAAATTAAVMSTVVLHAATPAQAATTLRGLAEARGRYFGTALTAADLSNTTLTGIAGTEFDMVTPGNEMKWDTTQPSSTTFNFAPGDRIVSFAVYSWDVVNEPYNEDGSLRSDAFTNAMGSGYIATALRTAHAADPDAKLYINDYNIEGQNAKSNALYSLAQSLLAQGVPLHGIGLESHFIVGQVPSTMLANMQRFAALGLDVAVTELDDRIPTPASNANIQQQGTDYGTIVKNCLAVARCPGISQWGVDDGHSWIPGTFPGYGAAMMWDANYQPKPAYTAAVAALSAANPSTSQSSSARPSSAATIAPGASVGIGFQATHTGTTAKPSSFTLNGSTCAIG